MYKQINLLNRIVKPNLGILLISVLFGGIIWFMPEMFGSYDFDEHIDVLFMKQFVLWSYPLYVARIIGFFVAIAILLWLMYLSTKLQILPERSSMPLIIGITIFGVVDFTQAFDENLFVIILFIMALQQLINMYHFEKQVVSGFNIIILLSIAALFEPHYVWLSLLFILGIIIFRIIKERVFLSILLGIATVIILEVSIFWLFDGLDVLSEYMNKTIDVSFSTGFLLRKSNVIGSIFIIVLLLFTLISCLTSNYNLKLNVRLNFTFISWCFWISLVWVIFFAGEIKQLLAIPGLFATLCLSLYFTTHKKNLANIVFLIYFISIIAYRIVWCLGM